MAFGDVYRDQVALLIRVLPYIAAEDCLALKGGTAINLFHREMPRLSVDNADRLSDQSRTLSSTTANC